MKKTFLAGILIFTAVFAFSQENAAVQAEDEIELPDVTTVITGGALKAGKEAVPDYKPLLPGFETGKIELPELEKIENAEGGAVAASIAVSDKTVYAEGQAGGGFPFYFTGDFSVCRNTGTSPFEINFSHESFEGFGSKKASNGFFLRNTKVDAVKQFNSLKNESRLKGSYSTTDAGFQTQSPVFTDQVNHVIDGDAETKFNFDKGFSLAFGADAGYFYRYGTMYKGSVKSAWAFEDGENFFEVLPFIDFGWNSGSFNAGFKADYQAEINLMDTGTLEKAAGSSSAESSHRGNFRLYGGWHNDYVKLSADAGIIAGTAIGANSVLVPFTVKSEISVPEVFSSRSLGIFLEGGMESNQESVKSLESRFLYAVLNSLPVESSDWYGIVKADVPLKDFLTFSAGAEFRKTAFNNGVWMPDYRNDSQRYSSGFYSFSQKNRTELNTEAEISVTAGNLKFNGSVKSFWMEVPSYCDEHCFKVSVLYQSEGAGWNAGLNGTQAAGNDADYVPQIDGIFSVSVSPSIRLALEANDVIKLITNKTRKYNHSAYEAHSGNVSVFVKFQF